MKSRVMDETERHLPLEEPADEAIVEPLENELYPQP